MQEPWCPSAEATHLQESPLAWPDHVSPLPGRGEHGNRWRVWSAARMDVGSSCPQIRSEMCSSTLTALLC